MKIKNVDWKEVSAHYAQYTPEELAAMCQPKKCPLCNEAEECKKELAASHERFLQSQLKTDQGTN